MVCVYPFLSTHRSGYLILFESLTIQQFCYPYGDPFNRGNRLQQRKIISMLASNGYIGATTAFGITGSLQGSSNPFALLRIPVYGNEWFQGFVANLPWT